MRLGKNDKAVHYVETAIDGITVYYHPFVSEVLSKITVKVEKFLFFKNLVVSGV